MNDTARLQIGEIARRAKVSIRTVRYYEEIGLLQPSGLTSGGIRLYTEADVTRLRFIRRLKALGLSIEEIKMSLVLPKPMPDRQQRVERTVQLLNLQKVKAEEQIAELAQLHTEIDEALRNVSQCLSCNAAECAPSCPNVALLL